MRRINELDSIACKFLGDPADQRVRVSLRKSPQHLEHTHVGNHTRENLHMLHLPRHDGLLDTFFFEKGNHLSELADSDPQNLVSDFLDTRIRLFLDCGHDQSLTSTLCALDDEKWKFSVACNQSERHSVNPTQKLPM